MNISFDTQHSTGTASEASSGVTESHNVTGRGSSPAVTSPRDIYDRTDLNTAAPRHTTSETRVTLYLVAPTHVLHRPGTHPAPSARSAKPVDVVQTLRNLEHSAVRRVVLEAIERGADANAALMQAVSYRDSAYPPHNEDQARYRPDPAVLHGERAVRDRQVTDIVNALLKLGANPDRSARSNDPPLRAAAAAGNVGAVKALLAAGADPLALGPDDGGMATPLYSAALRGCVPAAVAIMEFLEERANGDGRRLYQDLQMGWTVGSMHTSPLTIAIHIDQDFGADAPLKQRIVDFETRARLTSRPL